MSQKGADPDVQDKNGNTPLHDMVDKCAMDESLDKYLKIWQKTVECCMVVLL